MTISGHFYFVKDEFYDLFPDAGLMTNKEDDIIGLHGRPCHYCFVENDILWLVPISSQIQKYKRLYDHKVNKYGKCDSILFGFVNGRETAFLVQNCFPVKQSFIREEYCIERGTIPVTVSFTLMSALNGAVRKVIRLYRRGIKTTLTDISRIMSYLKTIS